RDARGARRVHAVRARRRRRLGVAARPGTSPLQPIATPCGSSTMYLYVSCPEPWRADVRIDKDLVAASATPLVLAILTEGESYGYAILKRVRALSGGELEWNDGVLYPLLHRLRRLGYVTTEWRTPPEGRRRQYYMLTDDGRAALADQQRQWVTVTRALNDVWPGSGALLTAVGDA